jgi:hypothetical protein
MTFTPRTRLIARLGTFGGRGRSALAAVTVLALAGLVSSGCEDKHIGRKCDLDVSDAGTATGNTSATINAQAVECPSRICLLPAEDKTTNTGSLCTADCSSDDDCSDSEGTSNPADVHCKTGFACLVPTTVGDFCCRHLCVCKDFVDTSAADYHTEPKVCIAGNGASSCQNVH